MKIQTPKTQDVLQMCLEIFPGLEWEVEQDSSDLNLRSQYYVGKFPDPIARMQIELDVRANGSIAQFSMPFIIFARSQNKTGVEPRNALDELRKQVFLILESLEIGIGVASDWVSIPPKKTTKVKVNCRFTGRQSPMKHEEK